MTNASPVIVLLPAPFATLFPGSQRHVEVSAATVAEAFEALNACWPGMRDRICDSTPNIRRHIRVFVDGERATLLTLLRPGAEVVVVTAISGG